MNFAIVLGFILMGVQAQAATIPCSKFSTKAAFLIEKLGQEYYEQDDADKSKSTRIRVVSVKLISSKTLEDPFVREIHEIKLSDGRKSTTYNVVSISSDMLATCEITNVKKVSSRFN